MDVHGESNLHLKALGKMKTTLHAVGFGSLV
jgi:hypothetical protein